MDYREKLAHQWQRASDFSDNYYGNTEHDKKRYMQCISIMGEIDNRLYSEEQARAIDFAKYKIEYSKELGYERR